MHEKIIDFVKYNNAFTFVLMALFFGFGISFAANPELRDSVYSSEETIIAIDNRSIITADLEAFNFNLKINAITEDEKNYYAAYSYRTLAVEDGIWKEREVEKTLTVSKDALGGKDLGLYVARELGENMNYESSYLKRVKKLEEEKGESRKVIAIEYSGLIGKLLDPKEKVIEGYNPVIAEAVLEAPAVSASVIEAVFVSAPTVTPEAVTASPTVDPITPTSTPAEADATPEPIAEPKEDPAVVLEPAIESEPVAEPLVEDPITPTSTPAEADATPEPIAEPKEDPAVTPEAEPAQ